MTRLSCGVAIITYNGLRYLPEQLASITTQSRPPDHIVISDDCSTDGTWKFLEEWVKTTSIPTTLIRNVAQQGLARNFEISVRALETDLIFSCDQDDVWGPSKVESMSDILEKNPEVLLAHSDASLIDSTGASMNMTLFEGLGLTKRERFLIEQGQAFEVFCRRNVVTGATAVFRKELVAVAFPQPTMTYHDAWLALCASAFGKVYLSKQSTIKYRQHSSNLVGVRRVGLITRIRHLWWLLGGRKPLKVTTENLLAYRKEIKQKIFSLERVPEQYLKLAVEGVEFAQFRTQLAENFLPRAFNVIKMMIIGKYNRFSYEPKTDVLRDLLKK